MLTKEEREKIAKRAKKLSLLDVDNVYRVFFGKKSPTSTTYQEDSDTVQNRLIDLCDTSNMVELPLDKDGEVIHVGDTVYNEAGDRLEVLGIEYLYCDRVYVNACYVGRQDKDVFFPNELTHKATTTITENIEAFNEAVKVTAQYVEASMNECVEAMKKLAEVFNRVGDSDD